MNETVVEARNLTKRYRDVLALDDVSISLSGRRIYGLLGRNGAGKTTLMSVLTAQAFATSGDALVFGEPAYENDTSRRSMPLRPRGCCSPTGTRRLPNGSSVTSDSRSSGGSRSSPGGSCPPWA